MSKKSAANESPQLIEVTIKTDTHTHAGKVCKKGDSIKVTAEQRLWLLKNSVIEE